MPKNTNKAGTILNEILRESAASERSGAPEIVCPMDPRWNKSDEYLCGVLDALDGIRCLAIERYRRRGGSGPAYLLVYSSDAKIPEVLHSPLLYHLNLPGVPANMIALCRVFEPLKQIADRLCTELNIPLMILPSRVHAI